MPSQLNSVKKVATSSVKNQDSTLESDELRPEETAATERTCELNIGNFNSTPCKNFSDGFEIICCRRYKKQTYCLRKITVMQRQ